MNGLVSFFTVKVASPCRNISLWPLVKVLSNVMALLGDIFIWLPSGKRKAMALDKLLVIFFASIFILGRVVTAITGLVVLLCRRNRQATTVAMEAAASQPYPILFILFTGAVCDSITSHIFSTGFVCLGSGVKSSQLLSVRY